MHKYTVVRGLINQMRDDYAAALLEGVEDEDVFDTLVSAIKNFSSRGELDEQMTAQVLAFAVRRLALCKHIPSVSLHTAN